MNERQACANEQTTGDSVFHGHLARRVTTGALIFVGVVASIALTSAGLYALIGPSPEKSPFFVDVAKYIMAIILPVVAGWVGTVLAFYFGKENFEAATRNVTSAASALTSKEKLAATVAGSSRMSGLLFARFSSYTV